MISTINDNNILLWITDILKERFAHTFELHLSVDKSIIEMHLPGAKSFITLTKYASTFSRADSDLPCDHWFANAEGWDVSLSETLPAPGATKLLLPLIKQTECGFHIGYDIFGLIYWMLSRQEEVGRSDLDSHGRFPAYASHAFKNGYLERPIVDEWLNILGQVIEKTWPGFKIKKHKFRMMVSHDVDVPSRYAFRTGLGVLRSMLVDVLRRRNIRSALIGPWLCFKSKFRLHPRDPVNTFDWIMDLSDHYGLTSAFYFICGRTNPGKDADYDPEHPAIRELLRHIHARGHEIGLHPSYGSYQKPSVILQEAFRLKQIASEENVKQSQWGVRMHYLRWEHPGTLVALAEAGFSYDASLGYADSAGFRCGTCFEYQAFDPLACKALPLRIRPLIAMECSVMADCYMGLGNGQAALDKFIELKNACRSVGGCFTLLWHNSQLESQNNKNIYSCILSDKSDLDTPEIKQPSA